MPKPDHLERTAHELRQAGVYAARIIASSSANVVGTVKTFLFELDGPPSHNNPTSSSPQKQQPPREQTRDESFSFLPGQWLDVYIPGVSTVGGFSLISSPLLAREQRRFELAVKASLHPPAHWFHTRDRIGQTVQVRVGGEFTWPPGGQVPEHDELVFINGGVGLNPTLSMLRTLHGLYATSSPSAPFPSRRPTARLLYTSKPSELLFLDVLPHIIDPSVVTLFLTGDQQDSDNLPPGVAPFEDRRWRRLNLDDVRAVTKEPERKLFYVCGPPAMTDAVVTWLGNCGVTKERMALEKWW